MPYEASAHTAPRTPALPQALRPQADEFRSRLALASEEVRDWRIHHEDAVRDPARVLAAELGPFAKGRIDPTRLAALIDVDEAPDPVRHHLVALAEERFGRILRRGSEAFAVVAPRGGDLRDTVRDALADLGSAFGLGRAVQKARAHRFDPDSDHELLHAWPFHRWSPAEREAAPPIVVDVDGADLRAAGLAEFLDGQVRFVLRVSGGSAAAPLARLVSPGVFVAQAVDGAEAAFTRLAAHPGPGVVAVFQAGSGALEFTWDARTGLEVDPAEIEAAMTVASEGRARSGLVDLRHLEGLVPAPAAGSPAGDPDGTVVKVGNAGPGAPPVAQAPPDDVDRLAGWLLSNVVSDPDDG